MKLEALAVVFDPIKAGSPRLNELGSRSLLPLWFQTQLTKQLKAFGDTQSPFPVSMESSQHGLLG